jgi:hypothetical protein
MRLSSKKCLGVVAFSLITLPIWAAHTDSISWDVTQSTTIGSAQVKPGDYQLRAEEGQTELQVVQKGKVIAKVPVRWTQLPNKAADSEVQVDNNQVTQVQFAGRTEAIRLDQ